MINVNKVINVAINRRQNLIESSSCHINEREQERMISTNRLKLIRLIKGRSRCTSDRRPIQDRRLPTIDLLPSCRRCCSSSSLMRRGAHQSVSEFLQDLLQRHQSNFFQLTSNQALTNINYARNDYFLRHVNNRAFCISKFKIS